jgi:hypothetical protein
MERLQYSHASEPAITSLFNKHMIETSLGNSVTGKRTVQDEM